MCTHQRINADLEIDDVTSWIANTLAENRFGFFIDQFGNTLGSIIFSKFDLYTLIRQHMSK